MREVQSVKDLSTLFTRAVEAEYPIQEELILKDDEFFVNIFSHMFPEIQSEDKISIETTDDMVFAINQLDKITDILFSLAPSGYIAERSLVFLLQDLMAKDDNDSNQLVPHRWTELTSEGINKFSLTLFGDVEFVQWKEFITRNMLIPYPDVDELLNIRKAFVDYDQDATETISGDDYDLIHFWFEDCASDVERTHAIRNLLFKLYRCNNINFNYTAMLMDFCKG